MKSSCRSANPTKRGGRLNFPTRITMLHFSPLPSNSSMIANKTSRKHRTTSSLINLWLYKREVV